MAMWNRPTTSENNGKGAMGIWPAPKGTRIVVRYAYVIFRAVFEARTSLVSELCPPTWLQAFIGFDG